MVIDSWLAQSGGPADCWSASGCDLGSKSQMLTTLSPRAPECPMSFSKVLITAGYNRQVLENATLAARMLKNPQENQL